MAAQAETAEDLEGLEDPGAVTNEAPVERKPLFRMPNIRDDLRALPGIFRSKPILFLPLVLFLSGLGIFLVLPALSLDIATFAGYYIQFFFAPPALFTFFIAGFFAPRASYLIGFIYGLIAATVWSIAILAVGQSSVVQPVEGAPAASVDPVAVVLNMYVIGVIYGTLAAALAAWYRDFLRGMQERNRAKRVTRDVDERAKRAAQRQEARKLAKQRPS